MNKFDKTFKENGVKFWELRRGNIRSNSVSVWNKEVKDMSSGSLVGHSVRVLYKNGWGFSYSERDDAVVTAKKALSIAKIADKKSKTKREMTYQKKIKADKKTTMKKNFHDVSFEEKKKMLMDLFKEVKGEKRLSSLAVNYLDLTKELQYLNSEGSDIRQELNYCYGGASVTAKTQGVVEQYDDRVGGQLGYELTDELISSIRTAKTKAIKLLKAKIPKGGKANVICDGVLTDVFVHEALGHAVEADHILQKSSCLEGHMGKRIAPSFVNIYDDATLKGQWGSYFFDDEGVAASKTTLVKNGVFKGFLHSRETAAALGHKLTGNGRAGGISQIPLVRMSNTYIAKGEKKKEELFEEMKNGYYLKGSSGGQVDTARGSFQFSCQEGFIVKKGEKQDMLRRVSLSGNTLELLGNILSISNKYEAGFPGHCGKSGQSVPVIGHCPSILVKDASIGGR